MLFFHLYTTFYRSKKKKIVMRNVYVVLITIITYYMNGSRIFIASEQLYD